MGIYVDYVLRAECAEEELRSRLERVRQRCLDLPLQAVGELRRIAREEGLLRKASDNCGYYASRSWKDAGERVNEELLFARFGSGLMGAAVGNLREEGAQVRVLEDNASKAKPVDFSSALEREAKAK